MAIEKKILQANNSMIAQIKDIACSISKEKHNMYIYVRIIFNDAWICSHKYFHVNLPTDASFGGYWKNGKFKPFTKTQVINDQNAGIVCDR